MNDEQIAYYGLPKDVVYCRRCVMSNQRPASMPEFRHTRERHGAKYMNIDADGICDACRYAEKKEEIDWEQRERELLELLDEYRREDGQYDCIVPGSGGKDSAYAAHLLKYRYGMHPLTVTWPPMLYTDYGLENFRNWIEVGGFDNITYKPNGRVHRQLTKLSIQNLLHPFQSFILGQKNLAPKLALNHDVPLIFYGESEAEYGNPIAETATSLRDRSYYTMTHLDDLYLGGVRVPELIEKHGLSLNDLTAYLPPGDEKLANSDIVVHYLGYYIKWTPQEAYYYANEHTGFKARPFRSEGTYSKYNSIDDKIDDLHYYTTFIKYGLGRASYDASQEIRNNHLTREEGVLLVNKYDGEVPTRYFSEVMEYLDMSEDEFHRLCDEFRSPHLWLQSGGDWELRSKVQDLA